MRRRLSAALCRLRKFHTARSSQVQGRLSPSQQQLATNCVVFGSLSGLAELSQQVLLHKVFPPKGDRRSLDWPAVGRYVVLGAAVFSPVLTYWYRWLDRVLPGTTAKVVMQKVAMDIVVMDVPFYTAFYTVLNMLEGRSLKDAWAEVKAKLIPTIIFSVLLWTPAQTINFRYVPPHLRVVYMACVTFLELNVLALMKRIPHEEVKKVKVEAQEATMA